MTLKLQSSLLFSTGWEDASAHFPHAPAALPSDQRWLPEATAQVVPEITAQCPLQGQAAAPTALVLYLFSLEENKQTNMEILENQVYSHQLLALPATQGILVCLHPHLDPSGFKETVKHVSQREAETKLRISFVAEANEK